MRPTKINIIAQWRKNNPTGKKCQCMRELKLTRPTCDKFWDVCGEGEKKRTPREAVENFRLTNPHGKKADCIRETGLDKKTVYKYWAKTITIREDKESGQLFFSFLED